MTTEKPVKSPAEGPKTGGKAELAASARNLVRSALKGYLATLKGGSGHPYASLVTVATDSDGAPLFLISSLAVHTHNLLADARASLLIDGTGVAGDPLAGGRVTLLGRAEPTDSATAKARFLARHPESGMYAGFSDFSFYRLAVEHAHFVGGFGRIVDFSPSEILTEIAGADSLVNAEAEIVQHMNEDHADALELYATCLAGEVPGPWRTTGVDPEGLDLVAGGNTCRIAFAHRVTSPAAVRQELVRLAAAARTKS